MNGGERPVNDRAAIRGAAVAVLGAAALALAVACGPGLQGRPAASSTAASSADVAHIWHQFAQCVRDHGDPGFPDPTIDAQGHPNWPSNVQRPSAQGKQACASILDRLTHNDEPSSHPDVAMMLRFAQCMRAHGITDWPDPDDQGRFHMPPALGNMKAGPRWNQIRAAMSGACRQYNTAGGIEIAQ